MIPAPGEIRQIYEKTYERIKTKQKTLPKDNGQKHCHGHQNVDDTAQLKNGVHRHCRHGC